MMLRPAIGDLLTKIGDGKKDGTRYALVIAVAKRARRICEEKELKGVSKNLVSIAVKEIDEGLVKVTTFKGNDEQIIIDASNAYAKKLEDAEILSNSIQEI